MERGLFSKTRDLKIKCTATIDPIYWKSTEESIDGFPKRYYLDFWNSGNYIFFDNDVEIYPGKLNHTTSNKNMYPQIYKKNYHYLLIILIQKEALTFT